ncbi:MAG: DUF222 domain-containing protein [Actinomycetes bacterium]
MFETVAAEPTLLSLVGYATPGESVAACRASRPGPLVMQALSRIDPGDLSDAEQLEFVEVWDRCIAWAEAGRTRALAAMDFYEPGHPLMGDRALADETLHSELAPVLRMAPATAAKRLDSARTLYNRLPATWSAMAAGDLGHMQAVTVAEELGPLDPATAARIEATVLPRLPGRDVGGVRRLLRHEILRDDPARAEERARRALAERRVRHWPVEDGMGTLQVTHGAIEAQFIFDTLSAWARTRGAVQTGMDAGRADALVELCQLAVSGGLVRVIEHPVPARSTCAGVEGEGPPVGAAVRSDRRAGGDASTAGGRDDPPEGGRPDNPGPSSPRPPHLPVCLNVTVSLETLLGLRDDPAQLEGYGPIPPFLARELAGDSRWRRFVTDPVDGHLLDFGRAREAPLPLRNYLVHRDRTCRFPGCRRRATRCDCDHAQPYSRGGETTSANCGMLCHRHHKLKTLGLLRLAREPDGTVTWTTHLGRTYRVPPPRPDETI